MAQKEILPAVNAYLRELSMTVSAMKAALPDLGCAAQEKQLQQIATLCNALYQRVETLNTAVVNTRDHEINIEERAQYYKNNIFTGMKELRAVADELETLVAEDYWPFPTYGDLLFKTS